MTKRLVSVIGCSKWRMDKSSTISHFRTPLFLLLLIGLLCFGVVIQILGASCSFSDMNESEDLVKSSLLEGVSLPAGDTAFLVPRSRPLYSLSPLLHYEILLSQSLFHPPNSHV
jgi:hypothetical protein